MLFKLIKQNFLIIIVLIVAFGLRLPLLNGSFWLDEAAQALESSRPFTQQLNIRADFQPPFIHYLTHFAMYISTSEWWLRMVAALIPGLITIFATYKIGQILFSNKVAVVSSVLLATSSFHIFYSQELRPYSLPAMFGLLSWMFLFQIIHKQKDKKVIKIKPLKLSLDRRIFFLTIINALGLYSSYLYPFLLLSQLIYVWMMERKFIHKLVFSLILTSISFLPWVPNFLGQLEEGGMVRQQLPGWEAVVSITQIKAISLTFGKFIYGVLNIDLTLIFTITTLVLLLIVLLIYKDVDKKDLVSYFKNFIIQRTKSKQKMLKPLFVLLIAFIVPLLTAWLVSFWIPILRPKRVLYILPFFYLIIASSISFAKKKVFAYLLVSILLVINFYSTYNYYTSPELQRENWRDLYDQVVTLYPKENSVAIFSHPAAFSPWRWYDNGSYPEISTGTLHVDQVIDMKEKFKEINDYDYVLVFDYLRSLSDPENKIVSEVTAYGYQQIDIINYPGIGFVRVFAKIDSVLSYHSGQF
jgi:mannosyltransferase